MVLRTQSATETVQAGKWIGKLLQAGDVVALGGELGSGKTHFIKGLAAGVGVGRSNHITSPSFTFIHEYQGRIPFFHIDLFRLTTEEEAEDLGVEEYFGKGGVTAIEWADRIPTLLPEALLWVTLSYRGEHARLIEILGKGERYEELVKALRTSPWGIQYNKL
ncbi:MAG TPA: tRNA (adenosine(37)-N6)-threonylcarbamoyltransferase complex ATPase subunit type 1 TsaE [Thermodesulfobacteriota bacterium]|nr:tRNA (adenosine(37)-N6)-threonylcarbamoyltransferase complex ATPase subunit type 1 TsaE [Thermodesulfobacteriota bacterium]